MELSWTTFILEAINFLVLVWLLKRLFYAPVQRAIARRRAAIEKTMQDAVSTRREAEDLKSRYEGRLKEWNEEKERQREEFRKELAEEKARQLKRIENAVAMEREKAEAQENRKAAERRANDEKEAMRQALEFSSRLLGDLASPELETKIVDLVIKQISSAQPGDLPVPGASSEGYGGAVQVRSAHTLNEPQRNALSAALKNTLHAEMPVNFEVEPKLMAGVEIAIGSYVMRANLRDELEYFSAARNHE